MSSARRRVLSAAVLGPVVFFLLWIHPWTALVLMAVFTVLGGIELGHLLRRIGWIAPGPVATATAIAVLAAAVALDGGPGEVLAAALLWGCALFWLVRPSAPQKPRGGISSWGIHMAAAAYLGLGMALLGRLETGPWPWESALRPPGAHRLFYALIVVWASDTFAYLTGSAIGRHKLWPSVSPKKTWEGSLGGVVAATAAGALLTFSLVPDVSAGAGALLGAGGGVAAQIGDLLESRFKRVAGVKDSGSCIPGHGGALDRLDSLLYAAPVFYYGLNGFPF